MTEVERQAIYALKQEATEVLQTEYLPRLDEYSSLISCTDRRMTEYITTVITNPDKHCCNELVQVLHFFRLRDKGYKWNQKRAKQFIEKFEQLWFVDEGGMIQVTLTPVQVFIFACIYGFATEDGRRLIRDVILFCARKFGKTTIMSGMAVLEMLYGPKDAQVYVASNSYNQAKIAFDMIRNSSEQLGLGKKIKVNREKIFYTDSERGYKSTASALSKNPRKLDGLKASLVLIDEFSQAKNNATEGGAALRNVLTTSMMTRREPLTVTITTASDVLDGPFFNEMESYRKMLRGEMEWPDSTLLMLFEPDPDDKEDDPVTWGKVQPNMGYTVLPENYEYEWSKAQLSAENMLAFRTKLINIFCVNETKAWFDPLEVQKRFLKGWTIEDGDLPPRTPCVCSFDLSSVDDFTALGYTFYFPQTHQIGCYLQYYFPEGRLKGHQNEQLYRRWAEEGHLILIPGELIDPKFLSEDIVKKNRYLKIVRIAYDANKAAELRNNLIAAGFKDQLFPFWQSNGSYNISVDVVEGAMLRKVELPEGADIPPYQLFLNDNPINAWCFGNAILDTDRQGYKRPVKGNGHAKKIDGAVTVTMGVGTLYKINQKR